MGLFSRKKKPTADEIIFKHISLALDGATLLEGFAVLLEATKNLLAHFPVKDRRELGLMMLNMVMVIAKPDEDELKRLLPEAAKLDTEIGVHDPLFPLAERVQWAIRNGAIEAQDNNLGAVASAIASYVGIMLKDANPARGVALFSKALVEAEQDPNLGKRKAP